MFNFTNTMRRFVLACTLALSSLAAHADVIPTYKVTINTGAGSGPGYLDFSFIPGGGAAPAAIATISNFMGAPVTVDAPNEFGTVTDLGPNSFSMLNDFSYRGLITELGGVFTFDLVFSGDFLSLDSLDVSDFAVAVYDGNGMLGGQPAVIFSLFSPNNGAPAAVDYSVAQGLGNVAEVAEVPEPSELLLVLTGLGLVGLLRRRRASAK